MSTSQSKRQRVAVIGGGVVGLSTAWFLQNAGAHVTLFEKGHVGGEASQGNAGWITPGMAAPLPEPAMLRAAPRLLLSPSSPVTIRPSLDPSLMRFLAGFARNATRRRWHRGLKAFAGLNNAALEAFDILQDAGLTTGVKEAAPLAAAWTSEAQRQPLIDELHHMASFGVPISMQLASGEQIREVQPVLSKSIRAGLFIHEQRYGDPRTLCTSLAHSLRMRHGVVKEMTRVTNLVPVRDEVVLTFTGDEGSSQEPFDQVVIATGALNSELAKPFGVRTVVQAGRGYSFTVTPEIRPEGPLYLPGARLACTPLDDGFRIAGLMEFDRASAPFVHRRIETMVRAAGNLLSGVDFNARRDEWVGARPCTPDGLPLIGHTRSPRVHVAGGHGMWGVTLGPQTGRLLAQQVLTGVAVPELLPFSPLR